jgi:hypothetical protein
MGEGRKNATKTVTCQIDDLRLVAGNVVCLGSSGLKYVWRAVTGFQLISNLALRNEILCCGGAQNLIVI